MANLQTSTTYMSENRVREQFVKLVAMSCGVACVRQPAFVAYLKIDLVVGQDHPALITLALEEPDVME